LARHYGFSCSGCADCAAAGALTVEAAGNLRDDEAEDRVA
jgi:hypothetical protein